MSRPFLPVERTEEYYIEKDAFIRYINEKVNPARKNEGLKEIGMDEARECFRIIYDFQKAW